MKKILFIIPLVLIVSSCTNTGSIGEQPVLSEQSSLSERSSYTGPTTTFSETIKTYFGDNFEVGEMRYFRYYGSGQADGRGKAGDLEKYPQVVTKLDEIQFHPLEQKVSSIPSDYFNLRVTGYIDSKQAGVTFYCDTEYCTLRCLQYVDTDVDFELISYISEDYFTSAQALFDKLFRVQL